MPADHVNINHPERHGTDSDRYRSILEHEKLKVELAQIKLWYDVLESDLTAIFTRIERGDSVELHYPNGSVYVVTGKPR